MASHSANCCARSRPRASCPSSRFRRATMKRARSRHSPRALTTTSRNLQRPVSCCRALACTCAPRSASGPCSAAIASSGFYQTSVVDCCARSSPSSSSVVSRVRLMKQSKARSAPLMSRLVKTKMRCASSIEKALLTIRHC